MSMNAPELFSEMDLSAPPDVGPPPRRPEPFQGRAAYWIGPFSMVPAFFFLTVLVVAVASGLVIHHIADSRPKPVPPVSAALASQLVNASDLPVENSSNDRSWQTARQSQPTGGLLGCVRLDDPKSPDRADGYAAEEATQGTARVWEILAQYGSTDLGEAALSAVSAQLESCSWDGYSLSYTRTVQVGDNSLYLAIAPDQAASKQPTDPNASHVDDSGALIIACRGDTVMVLMYLGAGKMDTTSLIQLADTALAKTLGR